MFKIGNDGPEIAFTDYWQTEHAKQGFYFLSWNAGAARLLVPKAQEALIPEMRTGQMVIITRGRLRNEEGLEVMFEDHSDAPFTLHFSDAQTDRRLPAKDNGRPVLASIWTEAGKVLELPGGYRVAKDLPYMKAWKG